MARMLVVVGDRLHQGGAVVSGSPYTDIDGMPVARVNDRVLCAVHGAGVIVSGDATLIIDGQPVARQGDKASCGCMLLAGKQTLVSVDSGGSAGSAGSAEPSSDVASSLVNTGVVPYAAGPAKLAKPAKPAELAEPGCWLDDHCVQVSVNPDGRYYQRYTLAGERIATEMVSSFQIDVPLSSGGDIAVTVRLRLGTSGAVSTADISNAKSRLREGLAIGLNNKFKMRITDAPCGSRIFAIRYEVEFVHASEDFVILLHDYFEREELAETTVHVDVQTDAQTYAHELAHCLGLPDEYVDEPLPDNHLTFFLPNGVADSNIVVATSAREESDPEATLMFSGNTVTKPRHAWNIGIEVRELLVEALGREVRCEII